MGKTLPEKLARKQSEMKRRMEQQAIAKKWQGKRPKKQLPKPRVRSRWGEPGYIRELELRDRKLKRRVAARSLLLNGWTVSQVASNFGVEPDAVHEWIAWGMPTVDDAPVKSVFDF